MSEDEAREPAKPRARLRRWVERLAPYVIAIVAITMVLRRYSPSSIAREIQRGSVLGMVPFAVMLLSIGIVMVASADWVVIKSCTGGPRFGVQLRGKIGAATLNVIGYAAQTGGYGLWIARVTGTSVALTGGIVIVILLSELCAVSSAAALSIWLLGLDVPASLRWGAAGVAVGLLLGMLIAASQRPERLPQIVRPWALLGVSRALAQLAIRVAHMVAISFFSWGAARAFGLPVPLWAMLAYFPVVMLVVSLPVNIAGFGAVQHAWLLLEPWAESGEQVLAFSLLWQLLIAAGIVTRGVPFVRRVVAEINEGKTLAPDTAPLTK
jgi:hypothetical protein